MFSRRFVTVYNGPCHTYKVQRLSESTTYYFKIQACNDAGEGEFSEVYAFTTTKSPPASLKGEVTPPWNFCKPFTCEIQLHHLTLFPAQHLSRASVGPRTEPGGADLLLGPRRALLPQDQPVALPPLTGGVFSTLFQLQRHFSGLSVSR